MNILGNIKLKNVKGRFCPEPHVTEFFFALK
jgi:hypothetical protein